VLVVEPGTPKSGQFISALKTALEDSDFTVSLPCPEDKLKCPAKGGKKGAKWCHFDFGTKDFNSGLYRLSCEAGFPKQKITLSFLFAGLTGGEGVKTGNLNLRIISGMFDLQGAFARYACSKKGLVLLKSSNAALVKKLRSAAFISLPDSAVNGAVPGDNKTSKDKKTGAIIINLDAL